MNNKLVLVLSSVIIFTLTGCNNSNNNDNNGDKPDINKPITNENIKLVVPIEPVLNMGLPIFAILKDGIEGKVNWESSDPSIISISSRSSVTNGNDHSKDFKTEGSFWTHKVGKVTITASLDSDPNIKASIELGLSENYSVMNEELFSSLTSGLKAFSIENTKTYDNKLNELTNTDTYEITTIFEENSAPVDKNVINYTDAYQLIEKDLVNNKITINNSRVKGNTGNVSIEEIDIYNNLITTAISDDEGNRIKFDNSYYVNILKDRDYFSNSNFISYDNNKTYHYVGGYIGMQILALNYTMNSSFYPDDVYFEVKDNKVTSLNMVIAPYKENESDTTYYSTTLKTTFSDLNTAKIDHLTPYKGDEVVKNKLEVAKNNLLNNKNYTNTTTLKYDDGTKDKKIVTTYTLDAIDQVIYSDDILSSHTGIKLIDNKLIKYSYDENTKIVTKLSELDSSIDSYYSQFDFSNDIIYLDKDSNTYKTRQSFGSEILSRCGYLTNDLSLYIKGSNEGIITFNNDNFKEVSGRLYSSILETNIDVKMEYSNINSSKINIDFSNIISPSNDSWETNPDLTNLVTNMKECNMLDKLPYLLPSVGYNNLVFKVQNDNNYILKDNNEIDVSNNCSYIKTNNFNSEDDANTFMNSYIELIKSKGYKLTDVTLGEDKISLYQKEGTDYYIGVANIFWNKKVIYIYACSGDVKIPTY